MNSFCDDIMIYYDMVYKIAFNRTRNYEEANDISQDVFLKCLENINIFETEEHLKNWLIRVTINMINKNYKSNWNTKTVYISDNETSIFENTNSNFISNDKYFFDDDIEETLRTLPHKHQEILRMFYYSNMKIKEIADFYCIKEATAKMRLSRARDVLKDCLDSNGLLAERLFTSLDSKLKTYFKEYEKLTKTETNNRITRFAKRKEYKNIALIVIDMANGWTRLGHPFSCNADNAVKETRVICDLARTYPDIPIIFFKTVYLAEQNSKSSLGKEKMPIEGIQEEDYWSLIDERLDIKENETIFVKNGMSCFCQKSLETYLEEKDIDTLIMMGLTASGAVRYSIMDAFYRGYNVIVPKNTIADRIQGAVYWNMFDIEMNFAKVLNKTEISDIFKSL